MTSFKKSISKSLSRVLWVVALLFLIPTQVRGDSAAGAGGWTEITASTDTRCVYVSSSTGNDANDGASEASPVRSLDKAMSLLRNGYPDHLLLKCSDVWIDEDVGAFISGRSVSEPAVLSYYGAPGERPLIKCSTDFIDTAAGTTNFVSIVGIHVMGYKMNPADSGYDPAWHQEVALRFVGRGGGILLEDCKLELVEIVAQGHPEPSSVYTDFRIRRCIVIDMYGRGTTTGNRNRPSGIYADFVNGLQIEECVFDHNGWSEQIADAGANMYNHNMYLNSFNDGSTLVVRGNIVTRGSASGIKSRSGGLIEDNLLVQNSIAIEIGYHDPAYPLKQGVHPLVRNNVILEGKLMDPDDSNFPRTDALWGISIEGTNGVQVVLESNIVANARDLGTNAGINNNRDTVYTDNIQYAWGGGIGDSDQAFADPSRSVGDYMASLGMTPTMEAFLEVVRERGLREWDERFTANAVNNYIREGFGKKAIESFE